MRIFVGILLIFIAKSSILAESLVITILDSSVVNSTDIRVKDLCAYNKVALLPDDIANAYVGESAPAGSSRFVDLAQVRLVCEKKSVSRLVIAGNKRVTVRTIGRLVQVIDIKGEVDSYIRKNMNIKSATLSWSFADSAAGVSILDLPYTVKLSGLSDGPVWGRVLINGQIQQSSKTFTMPIWVDCKVALPVVVSQQTIGRKELLTSSNCALTMKDVTNYHRKIFTSFKALAGTRASRTVSAGTILTDSHVEQIPVVERGDDIQIISGSGAVRIACAGRARESGSVGSKIWVENISTRKLIRGTITQSGVVLVGTGEKSI